MNHLTLGDTTERLLVQFDVPETNCSLRFPYGNNLYPLIDHRPDYIIHCIPESNHVKMMTIDRHVKKIFVEVNCAKNAD